MKVILRVFICIFFDAVSEYGTMLISLPWQGRCHTSFDEYDG